MKRILLIKLFIAALLLSTNIKAETSCLYEHFDLDIIYAEPTVIQPGQNFHITVEATNIPRVVRSRGIERVVWNYKVIAFSKLDVPQSGHAGPFGILGTHDEVVILDVTEESNVLQETRYTMLDIPEFLPAYENNVRIIAYMEIYYKSNFWEKLFGCDISLANSDTFIDRAVCHTPSISYYVNESEAVTNHIPRFLIRDRDAIARAIPIGQTETVLSPRHGGSYIDGLVMNWSVDRPDWSLSAYSGDVTDEVTLLTDAYSSSGTVSVTVDAVNCPSEPKSYEGLPIIRYVPRPDVVTPPTAVCGQYISTIEIEGHPFATGYVWELVTGPVSFNGANVQTLITTEPKLDITSTSYGYTHIRVRYQTDIDHVVENSQQYMMYDLEYDHLNALTIQTISNLRWRNFEFWAGGTGPTVPITQLSYINENCKGPVATYGINEVVGATRYEWEIIPDQTPAPTYLNDIVHFDQNKFTVDGYIRMNDGEVARFTVRVKVYGQNNCTPEIEEKFIRYRYFTNDPNGTCQGITPNLLGGRAGGDLTDGLQETLADEAWTPEVFPNPASDLLQVRIPVKGTYSVSIFNTADQLVFQNESVNSGIQVNVSGYPEGLYIMNIQDATGRLVQASKVLVKH